ncbi:nucleocapsid [Huangpi Tick Virus 3]|uniref:Nucleoprotein n=1 Tax=Huangpi Tick Virus 3 TaxID=1608049 RepID=A0A0B5KXC5_9RHAB|nr:nucleocapsid [Huangpi Tick Virus 3]AJG39103.1 nucleocapsid [Huangpi Tick Virus 3]
MAAKKRKTGLTPECDGKEFYSYDREKTTKHVIQMASSETEPVSPQDWFTAHPGEKPPVILTPVRPAGNTDKILRELCHYLMADHGTTINVNALVQFLTIMLKAISTKCDADWTSYGVSIGKEGQTVCAADIVDIKPQALESTTYTWSDVTPFNEIQCLGHWVVLYRLGVTQDRADDKYKADVIARASAVLKRAPFKCERVKLSSGMDSSVAVTGDANVRACIAAMDMFFNRFPDHPWAALQIGTLVSYRRDCGILNDLSLIFDQRAIPYESVLEWLWMPEYGDEMTRIYADPREEIRDRTSYYSYMSDLGLTTRSPSSISANPNLHLFICSFHALGGEERGRNARVVGKVDKNPIIVNAAYMNFAVGRRPGFKRKIFSTAEEAQKAQQDDLAAEELAAIPGVVTTVGAPDPAVIPTGTSGREWYTYALALGGLHPDIHMRLQQRTADWKKDREGSVGRMLHDYFKEPPLVRLRASAEPPEQPDDEV